MLSLASIKLRKKGSWNEATSPSVVVANHFSPLDILLLLGAHPSRCCFVAKAALASVPLLGFILKRMDITVDRSEGRSGAKAYAQALAKLEAGISVIFFPEGGIQLPPHRLKHFKHGAYKCAKVGGFPLQTIAIVGADEILPDEERTARAGTVTCIASPLWHSVDYTYEELLQKSRAFLLHTLEPGDGDYS